MNYTNVSVRNILTHLYTNYANITPDSLMANDRRIKKGWDPSLPIETFIEQIENAIEYVLVYSFSLTELISGGYE